MLKLRQLVSNKILVASVAVTSGSAFAEGANETAITAAVEAGKSMVSLTTSGVLHSDLQHLHILQRFYINPIS